LNLYDFISTKKKCDNISIVELMEKFRGSTKAEMEMVICYLLGFSGINVGE